MTGALRRLSLAAKLNLLCFGLVLGTAAVITAYVIHSCHHSGRTRLQRKGTTLAAMVAENCVFAVYAAHRPSLDAITDSLALEHAGAARERDSHGRAVPARPARRR